MRADGFGNQWQRQKTTMIDWMGENNRATRAVRTLVEFFDSVCQIWVWTHSSKSVILYIYFNGASTSLFLEFLLTM